MISKICRGVGAQDMLPSVPSSRLHAIWQGTVTSVDTQSRPIDDRNLQIISKYHNLEGLTMARTRSQTSRSLAPWFCIAVLAPRLPKLLHIRIVQAGAFDALKVIVGSESLRGRLQTLVLGDQQHAVSAEDLLALGSMPALQHLGLEFRSAVEARNGALAQAAARLHHLCSLELRCHQPVTSHLALAAAISGLSRLCLRGPEGEGLEDDAVQQLQQQHLAAAVAALTCLQQLETSYPLAAPEAQLAALSRLTRLSSLSLLGPRPQHQPPPVLEVLPRLRQLQQLRCPEHAVPWADVAAHQSLALVEARTLQRSAPLPQQQQQQQPPGLVQAAHEQPGSGMSSRSASGSGRSSRSGRSSGGGVSSSMIRSLELHNADDDDDLAGLPRLPLLQQLAVTASPGGGSGCYQHLAALLRRQAGGLQAVSIRGEPFDEALPQQLPALRSLQLTLPAQALGRLAATSMPLIESLDLVAALEWREDAQGWARPQVQLQQQLGWLAQLPGLQSLSLYNVGLPLLEELRTLLAAAGIRCVVDGV